MHPESVVEERRRSARAVRQHSMKASVQPRQKGGVFLVEVDQVGRLLAPESMAPLFQPASRPRLGILLPGEDEAHIPALVPQRHAVGERIPLRGPPDVHTERLIRAHAGHVELLVVEALDHAPNVSFRAFPRHPRDDTDDSRHWSASFQTGSETQFVNGAGGRIRTLRLPNYNFGRSAIELHRPFESFQLYQVDRSLTLSRIVLSGSTPRRP